MMNMYNSKNSKSIRKEKIDREFCVKSNDSIQSKKEKERREEIPFFYYIFIYLFIVSEQFLVVGVFVLFFYRNYCIAICVDNYTGYHDKKAQQK